MIPVKWLKLSQLGVIVCFWKKKQKQTKVPMLSVEEKVCLCLCWDDAHDSTMHCRSGFGNALSGFEALWGKKKICFPIGNTMELCLLESSSS